MNKQKIISGLTTKNRVVLSMLKRSKVFHHDEFYSNDAPKFIYFCIEDDEIVYVGKSVAIKQRIYSHIRNGYGSTFLYVEINPTDSNKTSSHKALAYAEALCIHELKPKLNITKPGLYKCGIRVSSPKKEYATEVEDFEIDFTVAPDILIENLRLQTVKLKKQITELNRLNASYVKEIRSLRRKNNTQ
jgi:hypothetical protein